MAIDNITQTLSFLDSGLLLYDRFKDLDVRFLKAQYYKLDKMNNLTNTWCILSKTNIIVESQATNVIASKFNSSILGEDAIIFFGVVIKLNKTPKIVETQINGFGSPIFQQFSTNSFDISIEFLESGPVFWQQNSKQLELLVKILDQPQTLYITNPLLNETYNIKTVTVMNYNIGQDDRFYSHTPILISLKSDDDRSLIQRTTETIK